MSSSSNPLENIHRGITPHVKSLRTTADLAGSLSREELRDRCREDLDFLVFHLLPMLRSEMEVVYPEVDRLLESEVATSILMRDQSEIHELVDDLLDVNEHLIAHEVLTEDTLKHLRQTLYSLHSQIESLFEKEEDVLVPLLTYHLPPGHVADLVEQMMESQS
ncbi:MAG: hypothetical protein RL391_1301 [Actinomycetota bacterium]|jgi:iron-sulfur cluster repair protein YtfE (RIC family)